MKRLFQLLLVLCLILRLGQVTGLVAASANEGDIQDYGQKITVNGRNINVVDRGDGEETIVWIPGLGDVAPALSYTDMLDRLSKKYRVVVIEPFGYGLSDQTDQDRTMENITKEYHQVVEALGLKDYYLMGHSIAGIYAMQYVNDYRDEVKGFIGIDSSAPKFSAEIPVGLEEMNTDDIPKIPNVSQEVNDQYRLLFKKNANNSNVRQETDLIQENSQKALEYKFPKDLPVCLTIAENPDFASMDMVDDLFNPEKLYQEMLEGLDRGEIHKIEGDHLLYQSNPDELEKVIDNFIQE